MFIPGWVIVLVGLFFFAEGVALGAVALFLCKRDLVKLPW